MTTYQNTLEREVRPLTNARGAKFEMLLVNGHPVAMRSLSPSTYYRTNYDYGEPVKKVIREWIGGNPFDWLTRETLESWL